MHENKETGVTCSSSTELLEQKVSAVFMILAHKLSLFAICFHCNEIVPPRYKKNGRLFMNDHLLPRANCFYAARFWQDEPHFLFGLDCPYHLTNKPVHPSPSRRVR